MFLPPYQADNIYSDAEWYNISGKEFVDFINRTYDNMVHWRKNLLKLPAGKASRLFINELTTWLDLYNRNTPFKNIVLNVFMTLPGYKALENRLKLWNEGKIDMLVKEARTIQNRFQNSTNKKRA